MFQNLNQEDVKTEALLVNIFHTLVPDMKRNSLAREGSKNAIFFSTVSYAATWRSGDQNKNQKLGEFRAQVNYDQFCHHLVQISLINKPTDLYTIQ